MSRNLIAWDPFREVTTMREDMERLFDSMLNRYPRERVQAVWAPSPDVEETNDAMIIHAELPGMKREDIKVTVAEDTVTISGERKYESERKDRTFHRVERAYGSFQRTTALPVSVQGDKAEASYRAGVLELKLPKAERVKGARSQSRARTRLASCCSGDCSLCAGRLPSHGLTGPLIPG